MYDTDRSRWSAAQMGPEREETAPSERHLEDWVLRTVEIIDKYRPQVLWFDWWIEHPAERELLLVLGQWLSVNGEEVYGTRPWVTAGEGPTAVAAGSFVDSAERMFTGSDFRFTSRAHLGFDYVYAVPLGEPDDGVLRIQSFGTGAGLLTRAIKDVAVLGGSGPVEWEQTAEGLVVHAGRAAVVKVALDSEIVQGRWDFF